MGGDGVEPGPAGQGGPARGPREDGVSRRRQLSPDAAEPTASSAQGPREPPAPAGHALERQGPQFPACPAPASGPVRETRK